MSQLFPPSSNKLAKASIVGGVLLLVGLGALLWIWVNSPLKTRVGIKVEQPLPYSHKLHVGELGLDCRYCHTGVEASSFAGIPPTHTCMTCHVQVKTDSGRLAPIRASYSTGQPIEWVRVHNLADFVYFDHSIHVNQGVGCSTCHGHIDRMEVVAKAEPMNMSWCLDCHRAPEKYLRPQAEIFNMSWQPPANQLDVGRQLVAQNNIDVAILTDCSVCHR